MEPLNQASLLQSIFARSPGTFDAFSGNFVISKSLNTFLKSRHCLVVPSISLSSNPLYKFNLSSKTSQRLAAYPSNQKVLNFKNFLFHIIFINFKFHIKKEQNFIKFLRK